MQVLYRTELHPRGSSEATSRFLRTRHAFAAVSRLTMASSQWDGRNYHRSVAAAYDIQAIEKKWQDYWAERGTYQVDNDDPRPSFYCLCMYPYPSGSAHQGHVRNYTFGDLIVRHRTMQGYGVLSPMGFDSFGLPAENAALKTGTHPRPFTDARIEELKASIRRLGAMYDWRREVR